MVDEGAAVDVLDEPAVLVRLDEGHVYVLPQGPAEHGVGVCDEARGAWARQGCCDVRQRERVTLPALPP